MDELKEFQQFFSFKILKHQFSTLLPSVSSDFLIMYIEIDLTHSTQVSIFYFQSS